MKLHLSENVTTTELDSYSQETSLCNSIIGAGVTLFLTAFITAAIWAACTAYVIPKKPQRIVYECFNGVCEIQP